MTTNQASIRSKLDDVVIVQGQPVSVSACENITSSVNFFLARKRVCQSDQKLGFLRIEKISIASLKDIVLTQLSRDVHGGSRKMKHQRAGNC